MIADSNSRYLTAEELDRFTAAELRLARNEIYARHGRLFNDSYLQNYFNNKTWYHGTISPASFDDSVFNAYEQANLDTIVAVESSRGS